MAVPTYLEVMSLEQSLISQRAPFFTVWQDLAKYCSPASFRGTEHGSWARVAGADPQQVNPVAHQARTVFSSGLLALMAGETRPWFRLVPEDDDDEPLDVGREESAFLEDMERKVFRAFNRSNFYLELEKALDDVGTFGSCCTMAVPDAEEGARFKTYPPGSYLVQTDMVGKPIVMLSSQRMTARQIADRFGRDMMGRMLTGVLPVEVEERLGRPESTDQTWRVVHCVKKNDYPDPGDAAGRAPYIEAFYLDGAQGGSGALGVSTPPPPNQMVPRSKDTKDRADLGRLIAARGLSYCPILYATWNTVGFDSYGQGQPGWQCLQLLAQIQHAEQQTGRALDFQVFPVMSGPSTIKTGSTIEDLVPGQIIAYEDYAGSKGLEPLMNAQYFRVRDMEMRMQRYEQSVRECYFNNILLKIMSMNKANISATQVMESVDEKMVVLSSFHNRMKTGFFEPAVEFMIHALRDFGRLEAPPGGLAVSSGRGVARLGVQYLSVLSNALKHSEARSMEKMIGFVGGVAQMWPLLCDALGGAGLRHPGQGVQVQGGVRGDPCGPGGDGRAPGGLRAGRGPGQDHGPAGQGAGAGSPVARTRGRAGAHGHP